MSSDWQKLADLWYRKRDVYTPMWDEVDLHLSVVAAAPYGGAVATVRDEHVFQPVRGSLRPELQTWTSAGRRIASIPWEHSGLLCMGWSSEETLVCVFESGTVRTFTVMCEPINVFTIDERIRHEGNAVLGAMWPSGIAVVTQKLSLIVNCSVSHSGDACHRCADLKLQAKPLCLCVLPPPHEGSADVQVIVGTQDGPVLLADRHACVDLNLTEGPYMAFAVSSSGGLLACLSTKGVFKVMAVNDLSKPLDVANIECRKKPKQMVWCGDDCIALYLVVPTPSNSLQHVLFVGGPQNDWIPSQYEAPLHLVPECDGCRILGANKVEFVQRVPTSTEAIYSIGNCDPPAMLMYALERFEKGDVCAQESLRNIKDDLADAVATCIDAATFEHESETVESLLNAAVFGRHFLAESIDQSVFVQACRNLRICTELRKPPLDIPLTVPQLERLGVAGITMRLAQRRHHLLASRICEWAGHPRDRVLLHWAGEKIRNARNLIDEQLSDAILNKFKGCPGIGYAEIARVASDMYRPRLATLLLNHEPRGDAQVEVLLQLSREGDEENRLMMLRLAVEKAAQSLDPDLIHSAISACGSDALRENDMQTLVKLLCERPADLRAVGDLFALSLQKRDEFDRARAFYDRIGQTRRAAQSVVLQVFQKSDADERMRWLQTAKDVFKQSDASVDERERFSMSFGAQMCGEEAELLKQQIELEVRSRLKGWTNGPHKFTGISLLDTLRKLIELGEVVEADNLRTTLKVADKRYWILKVRALSDSRNLNELNLMATNRSSPIGYEMVIEAFLKHGREDLALPFVPKVKNLETQAAFYTKMGMETEAQAARSQRQERAGPGALLSNMFRMRE
uniref:Vacuolar protein sorting-associated protein 16 homolog n=1 Tax=Noctiluca scintillans TaxID=2966 RepID=A0A7S1FJ93_NOCSC